MVDILFFYFKELLSYFFHCPEVVLQLHGGLSEKGKRQTDLSLTMTAGAPTLTFRAPGARSGRSDQ